MCRVFSATAHAGYLVTGGTIAHITNTSSNSQSFAIQILSGTGPCVGASAWIVFPLSAAPDADTHKRAYAAVVTALATGMRVSVYNYTDDNCDRASYVQIYY